MTDKHPDVGHSTFPAPPRRPNRQERRRARGVSPAAVHRDEVAAAVEILPGLPGGPDYIPDELKQAWAAQHLEALEELHPGMMWRANACSRMFPLGIPATAPIKLRPVRAGAMAPDGLGMGVLLEKDGVLVTTAPEERPQLIHVDKRPRRNLADIIWPGDR